MNQPKPRLSWRALPLLLPLLLFGVAAAQEPATGDQSAERQAELRTLRDQKQQHEVFTKAKWTFDFDAARAESKRSGKRIFAYFTRSYAH